MELNEYIRRNYKTPNPFILKDLGASDELIAYLRYTPENTNFNVADSYCGGADGDTVTIIFAIDGEYTDITPLDSIGDRSESSCENQKPNPITVPKGYVIETPPSCGVLNGNVVNLSADDWYTGDDRGENPITFPCAVTENVRITQFIETPEG